jgi:hypothetical protein
MRKFYLKIFVIFIFLCNFIFLNLHSQINNIILVKVGNSLITSVDLENEIVTNLVVSKQEITQKNINDNKNYAIQNLIAKLIKKEEAKKYKINDYSKKDLDNYIVTIAKRLDTNPQGLKEIFRQNDIDFLKFTENHRTELVWNTLIFQLYKNQITINVVEVDSEMENIKENKSEKELKKIKENLLNKKKEEKLNLFSRSHFTNLENTISIKFK